MSSPEVPANITRIFVAGYFTDSNDVATAGKLVVTPDFTRGINDAWRRIVMAAPTSMEPSPATGLAYVSVVAGDDPDLNPSNFTHTVSEPGGRKYQIFVAQDTPVWTAGTPGHPLEGQRVLWLNSVAPSDAPSSGVVQVVAGPQGPPGEVSAAQLSAAVAAAKLADRPDLDTTGAAVDKFLAVASVDASDPPKPTSWKLVATPAEAPVGRATAANTRRLMMKLRRGASNASVLFIGDSTGNQTNEWIYLWAQAVATMFPALTVQHRFWDEIGGVSYSAATTIQTGTGTGNAGGPFVLTIWNCSAAGQTQDYVLGSRWGTAVVPTDPDLVVVSHGHNTGDPVASVNAFWGVRNKFLALTEELAALFPYAGIVLIAQNPSFIAGREMWQARKADMYEDIAALRGYGFIDVHQAFVDDGRGAALTLDGTHPTDVGSQLWAAVVASATLGDPGQGVTSLGAPPLLSRATNLLGTSYDFSDWTLTDPAGWTMSNATATKDTTNRETGAQGMRLQPVADGAAFAQAFLNLATAGGSGLLSGQVVMFAVRLFMPAAHLATTRIRLVDNTGSANQILADSSTANRDRFCWMFITKRLTTNPTNITAQIYCRSTTGAAVADITVDRAYLIQGALPRCG